MSDAIRNKMYNMEATPPPGVWDRIAIDLEASDIGSTYRNTLAEMAVTPPTGAWEKISEALAPATPPAPVRRMQPWLKYAAAAALLAALAWGGVYVLNNNKTGTEPVAKTPVTKPVKNIPPTVPVVPDDIEPAIVSVEEQDARDEAALEESKKTYAKLDNNRTKKKIRNAAGFEFSLANPDPVVTAEDLDPAKRYIVLMTPDGNFIRMSKKWSDLVCCVSGEEQDAECIDQLSKWREKMAHSSQTASPGNFGDIIELVKKLQE
jgi:hypothetical protein